MIIRPAMAVMLLVTTLTASTTPLAMAKSGGDLVKVMLDVDVYAQPGGEGEPMGMLRKNSQVELINQRKDHWCNVQGAAVPAPGNFGWVWCGIGDDKQDYSLKPVTADMPETTGGGITEPTQPSGGGGAGGGAAGE